MARPWRTEFPKACYHLMSRGNNRQGKPPSFWEELRSAVFLGTAEQWEKLRRRLAMCK